MKNKNNFILTVGTIFLTVFFLWLTASGWQFAVALLAAAELVAMVLVLFFTLLFGWNFFMKNLCGFALLLACGYGVGVLCDIGAKVLAPSGPWEVIINAFIGLSLIIAAVLLIVWLWFLIADMRSCGVNSRLFRNSLTWGGRIVAGVVLFAILQLIF